MQASVWPSAQALRRRLYEILHHGTIGDPTRELGNGVLLWFGETADFDGAVARATELGANILLPPLRNPPEGEGNGPGHREIWLKDPDGYTVVMAVPNSHTIGPYIMKLPYDVLRDFTPITLAAQVPHVLVVGLSVPANSMAELVALAKANPGKLNFSSSGIGASQHLAGELFNLVAGVQTVHIP